MKNKDSAANDNKYGWQKENTDQELLLAGYNVNVDLNNLAN